ncbi:MAG: hypothetical protein ACFE0Q_11810 [Anaerolineae bacterium]
MTTQQRTTQHTLKTVSIIVAGIAILSALLLADLYYRGLAWQFFYDRTGEESPVGQIQGMVEWSGNWIRNRPNTAPLTPIQHNDLFPYGVNTFFEQETELDKMRVQFQMIADGGFGWIRQEFPWEDIEVDGRGQFTDSRVDYDGDGVNDTISAWDKYDTIVDLAEEYELGMLVRLSNPPDWSRANNPPTAGGSTAPPDDYQDFVNYAVAVAERYQGQIHHYQVWNEPNIYPEWGEQAVSPADYVRLLCMTYDALKAVDPSIVVISGTIAPTSSLDGYYGYHDLIYLQNLYDNGVGDCFDVLSAQGYGLNSGPSDERLRITHLSFARHVLYRDLMVANGDAHKPIWLSEVAWSPVEETCLETGECIPRDTINGVGNFGSVTNEQAARYLTEAYQRAQTEWSWVGHISYWHFTRRTIEEADGVAYWFRMVEADYSPENPTFSPLPVYESARDYITQQRDMPILYRGTHQVESWEFTLDADSDTLTASDAEFGEAYRTDTLAFSAHGTSFTIRYQGEQPLLLARDGVFSETIVPEFAGDNWQNATVSIGFLPQTARYTLTANAPIVIDSVTIRSNFWLNIVPVICTISVIIAGASILGYPLLKHWREDRELERRQGGRR